MAVSKLGVSAATVGMFTRSSDALGLNGSGAHQRFDRIKSVSEPIAAYEWFFLIQGTERMRTD
jgi:hypothetical protein